MIFGNGFSDLFDTNPLDDFLEQARIKQKEFGERVQRTIVDAIDQIDPEVADTVNRTINGVCNAAETLGNTVRQQGKKTPRTNIECLLHPSFDSYDERVTVDQCRLADHLFHDGAGIGAMFYTHHAIYVGGGKVLHYANIDANTICIHEVTFEEFAEGYPVYRMSRVESPLRYSPEEAIRRAYSRKCESEYNLAINNCENYVRWCRNGCPD